MRRSFRWGEFELDESKLELKRRGRPVFLQSKPFSLLAYFVRNPNRVIARAELERAIWPDVRVSDTSLSTALYEVRRALGDDDPRQRCIQTVRGYGYRFCAEVSTGVEPVTSTRSRNDPLEHLVDRENEVQQLLGVLDADERSDARFVMLQGAPGIGKTRLLLHLAELAADRDLDCYMARGHCDEGAPPFWPWIQILRDVSDSRGDAALEQAAANGVDSLARLLPAFAERLGVQPRTPPLHSERDHFLLLDGLTTCVIRLARVRPLLILLDDLHAIDAASLTLLSFLVRDPRDAKLVIVGAQRTARNARATPDRTLQQLVAEPRARLIELEGFRRAALEVLLERTLGERPSAELVERIQELTQGNPFFVASVCRALRERPLRDVHCGDLEIPLGVREAARARIAETSELTRKLLEATAVIGPRTTLRLLLGVIGGDVHPTLQALAEAEDAGLMRRGVEADTYDLQHGLVRETLYEDLNTAQRLELHAAIARAYERLSESEPNAYLSELVHHFTEAAALDRGRAALRYALAGAEQAKRRYAFDAVVAFLRRALDALRFLERPDPELRCQILVDLCNALRHVGATDEDVFAAGAEALELGRKYERWDLFARAAVDISLHMVDRRQALLWDRAQVDQRVTELREPLEEALLHLPQDRLALRARLHVALTAIFSQAGDERHARAEAERARALAEQDGSAPLRVEAMLWGCYAPPILDRLAERIALCEQLTALSRSAGVAEVEASGWATEAALALQCGDRTRAEGAFARLEHLSANAPVTAVDEVIFALRSLFAQLDGRFDDAERWALEGARAGARMNFTRERATAVFAFQQWWIQLARGNAAKIVPAWEAYAATHPGVVQARFVISRLYIEVDRMACARRELERADASLLEELPRDDSWLFFAACAAEVCVAVEDRSRAPRLIELITPYLDRIVTAGWIALCLGSIARQAAQLYALLGSWTRADELFELALQRNRALRAPPLLAWTELDYGAALLLRGRIVDNARAQHLLQSATERADKLEMHGVLRRARVLLR